MITAVIERCAGIDVGKKSISVCVMTGPADGEARSEVRVFGTNVADLKQVRDWIVAEGCTDVVMESTGSYWKPVFNILEDRVKVALANPHEVKARRGHKTDNKDAWWLAHLLRHAMITPSFIPPRPQRELRDLTRRRRKLIHSAAGEKNRVDKILQDANVKLSNALSDVFGVSGQLMLEALLEGKAKPGEIAQLARKSARRKIPEIQAALEEHLMNDHHRMMIRFSLNHLKFLEEQLEELDRQIMNKIEQAGYLAQYELLRTVPAVQQTAAVILAEMGPDPRQFPSEKHLSSWSGLCPGNNRSAGRNLGSHTTTGNRWIRAALAESAWAASRLKDGHLRDKFWRVAAKSKPKAVIAIAHDLIKLCYFVLQRGTPYESTKGSPIPEAQRQKLIRHHVRRLGGLGVNIRAGLAPLPASRPKTHTHAAR